MTEGISHFQEHKLLSSLPTSLQQQMPQLELVRGPASLLLVRTHPAAAHFSCNPKY